MLITTVFHILKSDTFTNEENNFLKQLFNLKTEEDININKLIIDLSFGTRIRKKFGIKPHETLIFYHSSLRIKPLCTNFLEIVNSIDNTDRFNELLTDNHFDTIGKSEIAKLSTYETSRINKLISNTFQELKEKSNSSGYPCSHYKNFNNDRKL